MKANHINIELMKYAMELCDKEEKRKKKREDALIKKKAGNLDTSIFSTRNSILLNLLAFALMTYIAMKLMEKM